MQFSESERREGGRRPEAAPAPPQLRDVSSEGGVLTPRYYFVLETTGDKEGSEVEYEVREADPASCDQQCGDYWDLHTQHNCSTTAERERSLPQIQSQMFTQSNHFMVKYKLN